MDAEKKFLSEFIDCYKSGRSLWDTSIPEYTSRQTKMITYNKLLNIMRKYKKDASVNDVKKKVNTLRSNYRREVKRIRDSAERGEVPVYTPILWWFDKFGFLKNLKTLKQSNNCNVTTPNEVGANEFVLGEMEDDDAVEDEPVCNLNLKIENAELIRPIDEICIQPEDVIRPKRHAHEMYIQPVSKKVNRQEDNLLTNYGHLLPTQSFTPTTTPTLAVGGDTVDHMCKAWAGDLREMDKHQRIIAGRAISEIIFQGQIGVLTIDSIPKMPATSTYPSSQFGPNTTQVAEEFDYRQSQTQRKDNYSPKPTTEFYPTPKIILGRSISIEAQRAIEQSFSSVPEEELSYDQ